VKYKHPKICMLSSDFHQLAIALATANEVLTKYRLDSMDQNPKGVIDLVGSATIKADKILKEVLA